MWLLFCFVWLVGCFIGIDEIRMLVKGIAEKPTTLMGPWSPGSDWSKPYFLLLHMTSVM